MAITTPKTDEEYINKMYDAKKESTMNTLKAAYDKNVSAVDSALTGLGTSAYEAKRQAAGDAAITRQRLNEQFAANGLNTGTVGQANLALLNQRAANLNAIELKKNEAEREYAAQKLALQQEYQNQVKNAILENDAGRAEALYKVWKEQQSAASGGSGGRSGGGSSSRGGSSTFSDGETDESQSVPKMSVTDNQNAIRNAQLSGVRRTAIATGSMKGAERVVQEAIDKGAITQADGEYIMQNLGADAKYLGKGW